MAVVAFTMLCGYYLSDVMAPLKTMLEQQLLWTSNEYGKFTGAYGWFNVFLVMLIIGGIILDKKGVRFTGKMATMLMVAGTAVKFWAVSTHSLDGQILFGMKTQVVVASLGFALFGVGVETAGITVSKILVKWFKGKELALAMGLEMATARLGTMLALQTSAPIAKAMGHVSMPILVALIMLCIGVIAFFIYCGMDKKLDASIALADKDLPKEEEESFKLSDITTILKNRGWWYVAILCVLFYSAVFPFLKFASDLMVNKFGIDPATAGIIPSLLPLGTMVLTPFFGNLYDRKGKGATIMIIGAALLIFVHAMFTIPALNKPYHAVILVIILGIGFSLVPSAMWPSVPKIIPEKRLGTAYAMIFWVQNIGLMLVPMLIGWVLDKYCITGTRMMEGTSVPTYNYQIPMMIFTALGVVAIVFGFLLKAEDKKKGYGLEMPNIVKE